MVGTHPHAGELRTRFAARVVALRPRSVLDIGCGAGAVLDRIASAGVPCHGVESEPTATAAARARGHAVSTADATRLPFGDGTFDLVVMRHVPHHLPDPVAAFAEAWRVAARGLVVAEPHYDPRLPNHRVAEELDLVLKVLHRRQGRHHAPNIPPERLRELVVGDRDVASDVVFDAIPCRHPLGEIDAELLPLLAAHGTAADRARYSALRDAARHVGVAGNGSVTVVALRARN